MSRATACWCAPGRRARCGPQGAWNSPRRMDWRRYRAPGRSSYRPGVRSPHHRRTTRSTHCAGRTRRVPGSSGCARARSCSRQPDCWTDARRPPTGCTRRRWPSAIRRCTSIHVSCSSTTATCSRRRVRRPESISVSTSCGRTTATRRPARSPGVWWSHRAAAAARSAISTDLYQRRSAPTRSPRSSPGRWNTSTSSSTWRPWRHAPI